MVVRLSRLMPMPLSVTENTIHGPSPMPGRGASAMLINACRGHPYLPVSLPRRDFMQAALERWNALSLPALDLKSPWHGYRLSQWSEENAAEAELAVQGRYGETGDKLATRRRGTGE